MAQMGARRGDPDDHPSTVSAIAWSGVEELATACYGRVTFSDAKSPGRSARRLEWKGSLGVSGAEPHGDIVACGSQDNSVHFWRRSTLNLSRRSPSPAAGCAWHREAVMARWSCGRLGGMDEAIR
jgi:hypothetical protein